VIVDRAQREEDLGKAIDAKVTALLAGEKGGRCRGERVPNEPKHQRA
jgi:hypothetical protein